MDDEANPPRKTYPLSPAKMSKTPSWLMLGFVLGAVTVWSLPPLRKERPAPAVSRTQNLEPARAVATGQPREPREPPQLTTIEAVFADWARYAVWDYDTTEVALWNSQTKGFTDFYEVRRYADRYYFRTLPNLSRRIITHGKPIPESPLQFTETEEQYQEWREHGRSERPVGDFRPLSAFPPIPRMPPSEEPTATRRPVLPPPTIEPFVPPSTTEPGKQ